MKRINFFLLVVFGILFSIPLANAVKTTRTISYFAGFVADASANTPYSKTFTFKAPDGISKLYYAKAIVRADMTTTDTRVYVKVDNEFCDPNYYDVPTNEKGYIMEFDCTGVAHGEGQYTAGFQANKNMKNVYVEWEFTYLNNPPSTVASIGGTEYQTGEPSRIVLHILDNEGSPINNGTCFTTVRNSNDTVIVDNQTLNYISGSNGLYFYEFTVEMPTGVYSVDSYCSVSGVNVYSGDTFHVAEWAENIKDVKNVTDRPYVSYVGGTEYSRDETVGIRAQFLKADGSPVTPYDPDGGGNCKFDLFSPNYTQIFDDMSMAFINNSNGIFSYDWLASKDLGIYTVGVLCTKTGTKAWSVYGSSTFHVSQWAQGVINMSQNGTFTNEYFLLFASATEYAPFENAHIIVQFMRTVAGNPNPINNADWCRSDIYFPNTTLWKTVDLPRLSGTNGLYFNISTLPDTYGVYTVDATCKKGGVYAYSSSTLHIAPWTNITVPEFNATELIQLINDVNTSVMTKLYGVQEEITDVGDTIVSMNNTFVWELHNMNGTIMWKLYKIQDEIANVNMTLINATLNITIPTEMNLTNTSINEVGDEIILKMLQHARILNKRIVNFHNQQYCISNTTLRHNITYEYCISNNCKILKDIMDEECKFGCNYEINECYPNPSTRWTWAIGIIIFIIILIVIFRRLIIGTWF